MNIELNRVALWTSKKTEGLTERLSPVGQTYTVKSSTILQRATAPLHRYAKNYNNNGRSFCLFVRTAEKVENIEEQLDAISENITTEDMQKLSLAIESFDAMAFVYTDKFINEEKQ